MSEKGVYILAIESSCDDTAAAVLCNNKVMANVVSTQKVHEAYGGVVPELASRAHQKQIIPVVDFALKKAGVEKKDLQAIAFTQGPGLMGSLLVGTSFAKSMSLSLGIPLIGVNHMKGHIMAHFIDQGQALPEFPFLCLTVSGGHTQLVKMTGYDQMEIIGETLDDAAGEAYDKSAKILGLPYPGGPLVDKHAQTGNPLKFKFPASKVGGLNFSFSGLKTSILYFVQKQVAENPDFISENLADLCASIQYTITDYLLSRLELAAQKSGIKSVGLAGGVSANSALRKGLKEKGEQLGWKVYIPAFEYCTDNAAMIGIVAYYKYLNKNFTALSEVPQARMKI